METGAGSRIHSDRRLPALTGLRIFAALAVYASHLGAPHGAPRWLATFFQSGYCGVTIFFVLSGFVLTFNYFAELVAPSAKRIYNYALARFARIYPLYLLVLLFVIVRMKHLGLPVEGWWLNAFAIQAWDGDVAHAYSFDPPAWSISVEFLLYACLPLMVLGLARLRSVRSKLTAAVVVTAIMAGLAAWFVISGNGDLVFTDPASANRWLYRTPFTRLGDFALGMLAAALFVQIGRRVERPALWLATAAAVAILVLMAWPALYLTPWSWDVAYAVPAAFLIFGLAAAPSGLLARGLSIPAVVLLGEASYAFYLIHSPAIELFGGGTWGDSMSISDLLYEGMVLGLVIALAIGLHIAIENPARRYLRRRLSA